jgi:alpha-1,6-mannosyltransferase
MDRRPWGLLLLTVLGSVLLIVYHWAQQLQDLRAHTVGFEIAFFAAFGLYLMAVALALRQRFTASRLTLPLIVLFAVLFRLQLLPTTPALSDDMFRYVWDGRVQAHDISPYRYPPNAAQVATLRVNDHTIWENINRKPYVTVYPPGAQMAFAGIWRIVGDSVTGFKAVFVLAELLAGALLIALLRALDQPPERSLIYFWSPLLIFEVAHAGHVDSLMLPLLIIAFRARVSERSWLLGASLGAGAVIKFFPALLLPALLPLPRPLARDDLHATAKTLAGFTGTIALSYAPYLLWGPNVLGFLPHYFGENFNVGLARAAFAVAPHLGVPQATLANAVTFGGLAVLGGAFLRRPAPTGTAALRRCVWIIGWFTLTTQNLFPWYLLWLLPLIVLFVEPGNLLGLRLAPISAWLVFSGAIVLSYTFFIHWRVVAGAQAAEFLPLYGLLALPPVIRLIETARTRTPALAQRATSHRLGVSKQSLWEVHERK